MANSLPDNEISSLPLSQIYGDTQRIAKLFYRFVALILLALIAGGFIVLSANDILGAKLIAIGIPPVLASVYLIRREKYELAAVFLAIVLIFLITMTATKGLGVHHISILGFPAILIVASLVIRKRIMAILTLYTLICVAWLVFGELSGLYTPAPLVRSVAGDFFSVSTILITTAIMVRMITESLFQSNFQLQQELRERRLAEEKYRDIFDNAIDGIFQSSPDGHFINVNPAMARMYGYVSQEDMVRGVTDIAFQLYVDPELRITLLNRLAAGEQITGFESLDYRKDGSTFWTSMNIQEIRDEKGKPICYEGTVENITERKKADEALRESEEKYRTLVSGMLDGVYRSSHQGKFVDVNPAMVEMFGYASRDEMLEVDIKKELYFAPEERESLFLDTGQEKVDEFRMRRKDGSEIWVEDHGHYVHDRDGNVIYHEGILRDITPRRTAEAERERLIEELAAKNNELEQFTYTVSHDLKAPIITIEGFLGLLEKDVIEGNREHIHNDAVRIHEAADKMHRLLTDLLELSRIGRMMNAAEAISFNDLARDVLDVVHGRLESRGVAVKIQPNLPVVYGDRQRLAQVLQNLIDNAAKFMGDEKDPQIEIGQRGEQDGKSIFFVKDNGIGIASEYHERIFGLFNKLDSTAEGTGIGLALVKRIVEVHGGRIWIESEPGKGSTFYFTLSISQDSHPLGV